MRWRSLTREMQRRRQGDVAGSERCVVAWPSPSGALPRAGAVLPPDLGSVAAPYESATPSSPAGAICTASRDLHRF
ncbi:hypothetical protein NBRGN_063_00290 [Nocardia brasiliensis NBRC 14402]|nr:hypothetical protein NBRGN_063_00290 [Nocardia brasiliensis NBRC 14402]